MTIDKDVDPVSTRLRRRPSRGSTPLRLFIAAWLRPRDVSSRRIIDAGAQRHIIAATGEVPVNRSSSSVFLPGRRGRRLGGRRATVGVPALAATAIFLGGGPGGGFDRRVGVPALAGSEPDTLVVPDVAVSLLNPDIAVAVAHDGRYPDGAAVGIETAWTSNGGRPGITSRCPG